MSRPVRCVFITHTGLPSGAELALVQTVKRLGGQCEPSVILFEDGPVRLMLEDAGVQVSVLDVPNGATAMRGKLAAWVDAAKHLRTSRTLARALSAQSPDVVVCNSLRSSVYGVPIAKILGVRSVWYARDRLSRDYLALPLLIVAQSLLRFLADAVIANSQATLQTLWTGRSKKTYVSYSPVVSQQRVMRSGDDWTAVHVGRISPWKGQDVFLRAFAAAFPGSDETAKVVGAPLFGEDEYLQQLKDLVLDLGIAERVTFTGHVDNVPEILAEEADTVVHSSRIPEPFGQVVAQAMLTGVPVVAARGGGPSELITHEHSGLLVTPGDVSELATALRSLRENPKFANGLAVAARLQAHRLLDPDQQVRHIEDFLVDCTSRERPAKLRSARPISDLAGKLSRTGRRL